MVTATTEDAGPAVLDVPQGDAGKFGEKESQHDMDLIQKVRGLRMSQNDLGQALGVSGSVISTWFNGRYRGDVEGLQAKARSYLDTLALQANAPQAESGFLNTQVAQRVFGALERIWETQDLGLVTGPAGAGKTQACLKFREVRPTAMYICILPWARDDWSVQALVVRAIAQRREEKRDMDWVCGKLAGSKRLLIVDDAHELSRSGYKLLIKLQDETGIALALVGNECMEEDIAGRTAETRRRAAQLVSRVGIKLRIETYAKNGDQRPLYVGEDVRSLVRQHVAKPSSELVALATWAANLPGHGHMRTLMKTLRNAAKLLQTTDDDAAAFRKSWVLLKRDVALPVDE